MFGFGSIDGVIGEDRIREAVERALDEWDVTGKKVLALIPDATRTCPVDVFFRVLSELAGARAERMDYLIALGTHPPMTEEAIDGLLGMPRSERESRFPKTAVHNHLWQDPASLVSVGKIPASDIAAITEGRFEMEVDVTVNRMVFDYDVLVVVGPVFPHEVVGFSGGNKYFFPGIAGAEIINFFHWFGALITNPRIIGNAYTPVRAIVDRAASMLDRERRCMALVVAGGELRGLYCGTPEEAWAEAAELSDALHIVYLDRAYDSVLSCAPAMYDDIWTAGKCMYKLEPVVADGGELIIYAPHVTEISYTHGEVLDEIGYHTRDFFVENWDRYKGYPWGVVAHSTHVRGIGEMVDGVEHCRVQVTLATGIPEARCRKVNLGYRDPASIDPADWRDREDEGKLYVPHAGETLYRLKEPPEWQAPTR